MNFLRNLFLRNVGLKAISILLAFLLWAQIAGQQRVQRSVSIPVEFINMPPELEITNDYPKEVSVVISRPSSLRMDDRQLAAVIDLSGADPGTAVYPLTEMNIRNLPSGVQIENIEQRRMRLQLERLRRKIIRVEPQIVGQPAEGYQLGQIRTNPSEVLISGPESRIEKITTAETESIDIASRSQSFKRTVYLDLEDPRLRIENTSSVDVFVTIEEERRNLTLPLPLTILPEGSDARISPRSVEVTLSVPISFEGTVEREGFEAFVTTQEVVPAPEETQLTPTISVPEEYRSIVRVESVEPSQVTVRR